ncbi:response regulator [Microbacterium halophytorum]|uniref:response regulator n=1 Tax=Microbacterium halophytorum TaxID=2067568 RepID=UPI000CFCAF66|nr:response regulator [Microbacterium halophytorum]
MSGGIRVLVVDDDAAARSLHARFVADVDGFVVAGTAATGTAALGLASSGGVDLVLLDLRLPDISGIEVLHRIRTMGAASPDVIAVSSSRDQVTVRQALAGRVAGYLVKPFTQEAFSARLAAYRSEHAPLPEAHLRDRELAQGDIDRLLATGGIRTTGGARRVGRTDLPKGIAAVTLERVVGALDPLTAASAAEVAERAGISRASARRYLEHLADDGIAAAAHRYGGRGRPEVVYRLAGA